MFGLNPNILLQNLRGLPYFINDYIEIKQQLSKKNNFSIDRFYPILHDRFENSGAASGHYFHQDLLVARKIYSSNPQKHVDIGSRIDGFIAHIAIFREVEIFDIRILKSIIHNVKFTQADVMSEVFDKVNYCDSISSLHAIEHFGLGRYGDPIDLDGHLKGLKNIYQALKPKGKFYLSVPIGEQKIEFNAHRVFSLRYLLDLFVEKYNLISFSYVNDQGDLFENIDLDNNSIETNLSCNFGCGIFELEKI